MTRTTYYDRYKSKHNRRAGHWRHRRPGRWTRMVCTLDLLVVRAFAGLDTRISLSSRPLEA